MKGDTQSVWTKRKIPAYIFGLLVIVLFIVFGIKVFVDGLHNKDAEHRTEGNIGNPVKIINYTYKPGNHTHCIKTALDPWTFKLFGDGICVAKCEHSMSRRKRIIIIYPVQVEWVEGCGTCSAFGPRPTNDSFAYLL